MLKLFYPYIFLFLISGCQNKHLQIFPELENSEVLNQTLSIKQMSQDIDALVNGTLERHPALLNYTDLNDIYMLASQLKKSLKQPLTRVEFFRVVGQLNHAFQDGHSFLIWPYQEYNLLKENGHFTFPFEVKYTADNKLVLLNDYQNENQRLSAGASITAINDVPIQSLMTNLQRYVGGETERLRHHIVARRFPVMLWSIYGWVDHYDIEFDQQLVKVEKTQIWESDTQSKPDFYWEPLNDSTAYLYLGHFDTPPDEFETFVDTTFAQLSEQNIKNLIIDIRDNPGGNTDTVTYLASYLANKPFRLVSSLQEKLNQGNRGWFGYKGDVGEITTQEWTDWENATSSPNRFDGKSFLLVGPISYSAAIVFATTLQDNQFATLIGETTGGFANQSAQGNLFNLPNSQLRAYITTRLLIRPNGNKARTHVVPEYIVETTSKNLANERDRAIEKALSLIENSPQ